MSATIKQPRVEYTFTLQEWLAQGALFFGEDRMQWRFVCPSCGHIQTAADLLPYKDRGATPDSCYFNCLGRYSGTGGEMCGDQQPCNYTTGGFLNISPVTINLPDGKSMRVFDFDRSKISETDTP